MWETIQVRDNAPGEGTYAIRKELTYSQENPDG